MSSALRRPAIREAHTKYFIVLQQWDFVSDSNDRVRSPLAGASVTGVMSQADFIAATADPQQFCSPPAPNTPVTAPFYAGNVLKDLGSVVRTYDQLGQPGSNILRTYRLVQFMDGVFTSTLYTEGAYGNPNNFYNTYWICTEYAGAEAWTAPVARMG